MRQSVVRAISQGRLPLAGAEGKWLCSSGRFAHAPTQVRMSSTRRRDMDKERADHAAGRLTLTYVGMSGTDRSDAVARPAVEAQH